MTQDIKISGYYINLDESEERRASVESNIQELGLTDVVKRFPALRGDDRTSEISKSELGCFLTHKAVIDQASETGFTLIFEDDVFLPQDFKRILYGVCNQNNDGSHWDILFLGQVIPYSDVYRISDLLKLKKTLNPDSERYHSEFVFLEGREWYIWGAFAYVIHPNSLGNIKKILNDAEDAGVKHPIDYLYREMINQAHISSNIIFPYIAGVHAHHATTLVDRSLPFEHYLHSSIVNLFVRGTDIVSMKDQAYLELLEPTFDMEAFIASQIIYKKLSAN